MAKLAFSRINGAIYNRISGAFNGLVQEINTQEGLALQEIRQFFRGFRDPFNLARYPAMMVIPDDGFPDVETMAEISIDGKIQIILALAETDASGKVEYYADALLNLWKSDQSFGGVAIKSDISRIEFLYDETETSGELALMLAEITYTINF